MTTVSPRAANAAIALPTTFRIAYFIYLHFGIVRFLADRLADRVEFLLIMRHCLERLTHFNDREITAIFGERTTVGMVRLFAKEAATGIGQILSEARAKPKSMGALSAPLTVEESRTSFGEPKKP